MKKQWDGISIVHNNLGEHFLYAWNRVAWQKAYPEYFTAIAEWRIYLKDVPANERFKAPNCLPWYDSTVYDTSEKATPYLIFQQKSPT